MGAKIRVVRRRIRSVQSTMKITRAMELIASSRIVKAQKRVEQARPYAVQLTAAMEDVARQTGSLAHPLLEARPHPAKVGARSRPPSATPGRSSWRWSSRSTGR
jgi:F-type H+-transporting ATPase subunit gamma